MNIRFTLPGSLFSFNDGVIHLFCVADVFSKYAWVKPLTDEKAKTVLNVSTGTVNKSKCKLNKSGSDQGRNFYNKPINEGVSSWWKVYNNFEGKVWKQMTALTSRSDLDYLDKLIDE